MASQDILKQLTATRERFSKEDVGLRDRLAEETGLNQYRQSANQIRGTIADTERVLENIPTSTNQRARRLGGPVTSAVLNRLTTTNQQPVADQLNKFSRNLSVQQAGLQDANTEVNQRITDRGNEFQRTYGSLYNEYKASADKEQADRQYALQQQQIKAEADRAAYANLLQQQLIDAQNRNNNGGTDRSISSNPYKDIALQKDRPTGRTSGIGGEIERGLAGVPEGVIRGLAGNNVANAFTQQDIIGNVLASATNGGRTAYGAKLAGNDYANYVRDQTSQSLVRQYGNQGANAIVQYQRQTGLPAYRAIQELVKRGVIKT